MTPYYQDKYVTLYHGDARDLLPHLPHGGLMVTDPPYNVGYHYDEHDDALASEEYGQLMAAVLRLPLVLTHYPESHFQIARWLQRDPDKVVAWVYHANTPRQWRAISWFGIAPDFSQDSQPYQNQNDRRIRQRMAAGKQARLYDWWEVEQVKNVSAEKTAHPCQIPMTVTTRVLRITPHAGPVIDPFAGGGSTLLAAKRLERHAIGIELSEAYCEVIAQRLSRSRLAELFAEDANEETEGDSGGGVVAAIAAVDRDE